MGQKRTIKKLNKILARVKSFREPMEKLTEDGFKQQTKAFKKRLASGEELDGILPEAFAAVCEASRRVLGMFPYDVQILGGIALHQGYLAEMNTGEGKTLCAALPLYLNALTEESVILVTANEYLALRDAKEMGQGYHFLGLSVAAGVCERPSDRLTNDQKRDIYAADIVYTTHSVLGFDYLLNNLVTSAKERFMRKPYYVIIDEADSVLLDSAQMPLVISGSPRVQSNLYELADFFVRTLAYGKDYEKEEKKVWLTHEGVRRAETFFQIDNFYGRKYFEINRHVTLALRAHALFAEGKEYMVSGQEKLMLLDERSGRMMPGVKLRGGQHQAIEEKEKLPLSMENRSVASITYQNLFLLFSKMAGMSGTLADASEELLEVYGRKVLVIPPNCPVKRKDLPDLYYQDAESQIDAAVCAALAEHETGRPVLIVVTTIGETELISEILVEHKIPHNVLNANNAFWEADIIREAGRKGAVTVATSMAGRGTDIRLTEDVKELGGLAVIGIGRMINIRQERQARGRAGRQGDPGSSRFFVSLEDETVQNSGPSNLNRYTGSKKKIRRHKLKKIINRSQALGEEFAVLSRKRAMDYDQVMQRQRELIYAERNSLLDGGLPGEEQILEIASGNIHHFLNSCGALNERILNRYILDNVSYRLDGDRTADVCLDRKHTKAYLLKKVKAGLAEQKQRLKNDGRMDEFVRACVLKAIDNAWVEQVDYLQQLQSAVAGRASAQRNLVFEYHKDALESFHKMERTILKDAMRNILLSNVYVDAEQKLHILLP